MTEVSRITTAASIGMPANNAGRVTARNSVLRAITSRSSSTLRTPHETGVDEALFAPRPRSEEHTSELQSLMRISYAVFCLKKKKTTKKNETIKSTNYTSQDIGQTSHTPH